MYNTLKMVALNLIIGLGMFILLALVGPFLVAANRFKLADRLAFLPGINGSGGIISGISAAIYIIGGCLLISGSVIAVTGAVPGTGSQGPTADTESVSPAATPMSKATPQQVSDSRKLDYRAFVQKVDSYSARAPSTWTSINSSALKMTVQADWAEIKHYSNHKHPIPESVLRAMNDTENPPKWVIINFEDESGKWLRTVTVEEEWADGFVGYEFGISAMQSRFRNTTNTSKYLSEEASIPRFHITIDDVRIVYADRLNERLNNQSWEPGEFNTSEYGDKYRPKIGHVGFHNQTAHFQKINETVSGDRVINVEIIQKESEIGRNSLGWVASSWADVVSEEPYDVRLGDPGLVLQVQYVSPKTDDVYHTTNIPSAWAQRYNRGSMLWSEYLNLVVFRG